MFLLVLDDDTVPGLPGFCRLEGGESAPSNCGRAWSSHSTTDAPDDEYEDEDRLAEDDEDDAVPDAAVDDEDDDEARAILLHDPTWAAVSMDPDAGTVTLRMKSESGWHCAPVGKEFFDLFTYAIASSTLPG